MAENTKKANESKKTDKRFIEHLLRARNNAVC